MLTTVVNMVRTGCKRVDNGLSTVNNALTMSCQHVDNGLSTVNNALSMGCQRVDYSCQHVHKIKKIRGEPLSTHWQPIVNALTTRCQHVEHPCQHVVNTLAMDWQCVDYVFFHYLWFVIADNVIFALNFKLSPIDGLIWKRKSKEVEFLSWLF